MVTGSLNGATYICIDLLMLRYQKMDHYVKHKNKNT